MPSDVVPPALDGVVRRTRMPRFSSVNHEKTSWQFRMVGHLVHTLMPILTVREWQGQERIPRTGGVIVASNHIGNFDPIVLGEYLIWAGRWPHYLGKVDIFKVPVLGWLARSCEQIPVMRNTVNAKDSLVHAEAALERGHLVAVYPEGTITRDPDGWPMTPRRGVAQMALETGMDVIPVAQTGAQNVLGGRYLEFRRLFSWRRRLVKVKAGSPVDLDRFRGRGITKELLDDAADAIMDDITALVAELRGETPPEGRWDMRVEGRVAHD